ncbi:MAG: Bax inhibitor-1/YccA family protein [Rhodanobacteraceae bacterium]
MRSNNPVLRDKTFLDLSATGERMTLNGTITRAALLLVLVMITGAWTWQHFRAVAYDQSINDAIAATAPFLWGGLIAGLVLALVTVFKPRWSPMTAPLYALAQGTALGGISAMFELHYPGIVVQAVLASVGVLAVMLLLYRSGIIKVTQKFRMGVVAATCGIALLYLAEWGLSAFAHMGIPFINGGGPLGIGFSVLVVCLAALNFVLDFDLIERGTANGAPRYMEWYCAFALLLTLIWLYMELLRLLSKTRR